MFDNLLKKADRASYRDREKIEFQIITRVFGAVLASGIVSYLLGLLLGKITNSMESV